MTVEPQETKSEGSRTQVVSVAVTAEEKAAVMAVASARHWTQSEVLREMTMSEVMASWDRMRRAANGGTD